MVLPDGTQSDRSRPGKGRALLFAVAALAIVAGFMALGSLIPSDPVAIETTTTTSSTTIPDLDPPFDPENFSVGQIATGPPLGWDLVAESTTGYPLRLTEHHGTFYLFTSMQPWWASEPGGLDTWISANGEDWRPAAEMAIGMEFHVADVVTSADGFIAIGARPGGDHLIVWRSADGMGWTTTEIPIETDSPYITPRPTAAAAFDGRVAIATGYALDEERLVTDHLAAAGIDVDFPTMTWNTRYAGEDGVELIVSGPLGIPVLTTSLDELGLTEQEHQWVMRGLNRREQSEVWVVDDAGDQKSGTIPLMRVSNMVSRPDGTLFATGLGGAGLDDGFVSADGLQWKRAEDTNIDRVISWGERVIGITSGPRVEVVESSDGQNWKESGATDLLPSQWSWYPVAMGSGPDGLAMTLEGQNFSGFTAEAPSTATVTSGDATLRLDRQRSVFVLEIDGETHTWDRYPYPSGSQVPEELEIDLANETVLFEDPETGETLAQFSFEELRRLESESRSIRFSDVIGHHALVFTEDGSAWEIRDLEPVVGDDSRVILLEVASGRLVAVAHEPVVDPYQNVPPAGFEVWSVPLP